MGRLELLRDGKAEVLDAGCGTGEKTYFMHKAGNSVCGVDVSKESIARARKRYPSVEFVNCDILDFKTKRRFDVITALGLLEFVDAGKVLKRFNELLKREGLALIETPNKNSLRNRFRTFLRCKKQIQVNLGLMSEKELKNHLERTGFKVLSFEFSRRATIKNFRVPLPFFSGLSDGFRVVAKKSVV